MMVCFVSRLLGKVRGMFSNANLFLGYFLNWKALRIFLELAIFVIIFLSASSKVVCMICIFPAINLDSCRLFRKYEI